MVHFILTYLSKIDAIHLFYVCLVHYLNSIDMWSVHLLSQHSLIQLFVSGWLLNNYKAPYENMVKGKLVVLQAMAEEIFSGNMREKCKLNSPWHGQRKLTMEKYYRNVSNVAYSDKNRTWQKDVWISVAWRTMTRGTTIQQQKYLLEAPSRGYLVEGPTKNRIFVSTRWGQSWLSLLKSWTSPELEFPQCVWTACSIPQGFQDFIFWYKCILYQLVI